jgi:hypothetical protein
MALGSQALKGNWALFEKAPKIKIKIKIKVNIILLKKRSSINDNS